MLRTVPRSPDLRARFAAGPPCGGGLVDIALTTDCPAAGQRRRRQIRPGTTWATPVPAGAGPSNFPLFPGAEGRGARAARVPRHRAVRTPGLPPRRRNKPAYPLRHELVGEAEHVVERCCRRRPGRASAVNRASEPSPPICSTTWLRMPGVEPGLRRGQLHRVARLADAPRRAPATAVGGGSG